MEEGSNTVSLGTRRKEPLKDASERGNRRLQGTAASRRNDPSPPPSSQGLPSRRRLKRQLSGELGTEMLIGLSIAGVASSILFSVFGMFHVEVFLRSYKLPLSTYSVGSLIFTAISTINNLAGAYVIDHMATKRSRSDLIGLAGCLSALYFLAPFFRFWDTASGRGDGVHYVVSLGLYDAMHSFTTILMGSVVNDNHHMSDRARVSFMASGKVANFVVSFIVARVGLALFDIDSLYQFRVFLVVIAIVVSMLFVLAQKTISAATNTGKRTKRGKAATGLFQGLLPTKHNIYDTDEEDLIDSVAPLEWRQIALDFWQHKNFRAWIGMEMLLEAQTTFMLYFLKTFVDRLLLEAGIGRQACDWLLSMIRPLTQIASVFVYIPIRRLGYRRVYSFLFYFNICLSLTILCAVDTYSTRQTNWIVLYICVYPVVTGAVQSAGFHLAQADLVMEMKRKHVMEGRHDEPSLAGLFMGANALLCKPVESLLPITAATVLQEQNESRASLFYLLVLPPLVCSFLQILSWRFFNLTPRRTARMRNELKKLRSTDSSFQMAAMDL